MTNPGPDPASDPAPDPASEETAPFQNPWRSPSGPPAAPAPPPVSPPTTPYPTYQPPPSPHQPLAPEPGWTSSATPPPYAPPYTPPSAPQPGYGYVPQTYLYAGAAHPRAATAMWLGITGITGAVLTPFCCITLPLLVCSPIAWGLGASARKQIDAVAPGAFSNRGQAQAGFVLGIIGSVLAIFSVLGLVLLGVAVGLS